MRKSLFSVLCLFVASLCLEAGYNPNIGRFLNRDPKNEKGSRVGYDAESKNQTSEYGFVQNNPIMYWDYLGLDFIALAGRPVKSVHDIFGHYVLIYVCGEDELFKEQNFNKIENNLIDSTELDTLDKKVWYYSENMTPDGDTADVHYRWEVMNVKTAYIKIGSFEGASSYMPIFKGNAEDVRTKWNIVLTNAKKYKWAEQQKGVLRLAPSLDHFP